VLPEELLYKYLTPVLTHRAPNVFASPGKSKELAQLRYERFERKRLEMLEAVRAARMQLLHELERRPGGSLGRVSRYSGTCLDAPLGNTSRISNEKSQMQLQAVVDDSNRANYDKIVQKAKVREMALMDKMLKNEEMKNTKYEEQQYQREVMTERAQKREREHVVHLKKRQEEKHSEEMRLAEAQKQEELRQRQEAAQRLQRQREEREEAKRRELENKRQREMAKAEKEGQRKEKAEIAAQMRNVELIRQQEKLQTMQKKTTEREHLIKRLHEQAKHKASQRRLQFNQVKERVHSNIASELQNRWNQFLTRQQEKELRESRSKQRQAERQQTVQQKVKRRRDVGRRWSGT
jgi:hypothetical protein